MNTLCGNFDSPAVVQPHLTELPLLYGMLKEQRFRVALMPRCHYLGSSFLRGCDPRWLPDRSYPVGHFNQSICHSTNVRYRCNAPVPQAEPSAGDTRRSALPEYMLETSRVK